MRLVLHNSGKANKDDSWAEHNLQLRFACAEDLREVHRIECLVQNTPWSKEIFARYVSFPDSIFYTAVISQGWRERVIGFVVGQRLLDSLDIINLAVHPSFCRRGVGKRLLYAALQEALRRGFISFTLEVRVSNQAARKLYASFGFCEVGVRKGYYYDNNEDAILMTCQADDFSALNLRF